MTNEPSIAPTEVPPASGPSAPAASPSGPESRRARGEYYLGRITGTAGSNVIDSLQDMAPELGHWIVDFAYGDVFAGTAISLRTRELATVSALTALGNAQPQLKVHIEGALNVGCQPEEIIEVILQMAVYAGFPSALNGIGAAREVFAGRGIAMPRRAPGAA
ncbi:4-carboxymuconolactone decarboxylase [Pseudoduganella lurida]|uniref:4-carboxymuconolactone decarboxylase n=1 Tax=Pseudoduganella lurida TaxID=1036180 RepID=A0A562RET9_9BURK|nr:carboxymuconolactone decarboxylase family protein [Pseudoduganella lurida]TWI67571.1 4-carboxymuconolactone decarboxylase [Pseudoduganella lurida]